MHNKYKCLFFTGVITNEDFLIIREHHDIKYVTKEEIKNLHIFPQDIHVLEYF